jgi:HlyD family secretion protein
MLHVPGSKDRARRYYQVVFVEAGGVASCRLVQTGAADESQVEILSGLAEGEHVIFGPYRTLDKLVEGAPIQEIYLGGDGQ